MCYAFDESRNKVPIVLCLYMVVNQSYTIQMAFTEYRLSVL